MKRKPISHIVRKQINKELRRDKIIPIISEAKSSIIAQDTTQSLSAGEIDNMIIPYIQATIGNRILTGYRVIRTTPCTGRQVYVMAGESFFDVKNYVRLDSGKFYTIPVYSDDQWVYVYLEKDGDITANKYSPIVGDNVYNIPLAMVWMPANTTTIDSRLVIDIRPAKISSISDLYTIRQQQAELYNLIPNSLVDEYVDVIPKTGLTITIAEEESGDIAGYQVGYVQGHTTILPKEDLVLTTPESGEGSKDYYIVAHVYIDPIELVYKTEYKQIEDTTTIERWHLVLAKVSGITPDTSEITSSMINTNDYQILSTELVDTCYEFKYRDDLEDAITKKHNRQHSIVDSSDHSDKNDFIDIPSSPMILL